MATKIIDYQRWRGLMGDDKRIYQMVSGIYGALGDMNFSAIQYNRATLDAIESLYYNITTRDICVISVNQLSLYLKEEPDTDNIVMMLDGAINLTKKAILVVKNNAYTEELLKLNTSLNEFRDTVIAKKTIEFKSEGWILIRDIYAIQTKDGGE
jgi:hypothetical protein